MIRKITVLMELYNLKSNNHMNHNLLKSWLLPTVMILLCIFKSQAQIEYPALNDYFKKYNVIQLQPEILLSSIHASKGDRTNLHINGWELILFKSNIFSPAYICVNEKGTHFNDVNNGFIVPMNGYTSNGGRVSMTIAKNFIQGFIKDGSNTFYIEPVRHFIKDIQENHFVIYNVLDIVSGKEHACGVDESKHRVNKDQIIENRSVQSGNCLEIEYAIAADWLMYDYYGSVTAVEAQNIAVVNDMQTNYDDEFNDEIRFHIVQQYIVTSSGGDPWTSTTDAGLLLNDFTTWGPLGFSTTHDLGTLWTKRNLDGNTVGLAWVGSVCTQFRYNLLEDYTTNAAHKRVLSSHEIGHNFNAGHDSGTGYIMSPSVNNTNLWSQTSLDVINAYYPSRTCMGSCIPVTPEVNFIDTSISISESGEITDGNYCDTPYKTITIPVALSRITQSPTTVGVSVKAGGTAVLDHDFVLKTTTLTFPSGVVNTQYISVDIINDAIEEVNETFTLSLEWISGPAQVGNNDECNVTIVDGLDVVSDECCSHDGVNGFIRYMNNNIAAPMIFMSTYEDSRSRFLYLASQLNAVGIQAGYISGISLYIYQKNSTQPFNNFRIGLKNVQISSLAGEPWYQTETVYTGNVTTVGGQWLKFDFNEPFYWDGLSALYFEYCFDNNIYDSSNDVIYITTPVGGGSGTYNETYVYDNSIGCLLDENAYSVTYGPGNEVFQPQIRVYQLNGVKVENTLNKSGKTIISAGETAHIYSEDKNIIASIRNLGTTDIGCLEAKVATVGSNKKTLPFVNSFYADKTIQIVAENNALYELTLYYSADQMTTWGSNAGTLNILKSNVPLSESTKNEVEIVRPDTVYNALGQDNAYVYKATFNSFSWFTLTDYNNFDDVEIGAVDLQFETAGTGTILQNKGGESYKLNINNSGQFIATAVSSSDYITQMTASGIYVKDNGKGVIYKSINGNNYRLGISNTGQLTLNSVTTLPPSLIKQQTGNISINSIGSSIILKSPDNSCWRVFINEDGNIRTVKVKCN